MTLGINNMASATGLGLAICKEIIAGHNGKIWAEPYKKGGSIFRFQIPEQQDIKQDLLS